jgi:hypothetical protein
LFNSIKIAKVQYKVIKEIYIQAQLLKANHAQCMLLAERVKIIQTAIKKIREIPNKVNIRSTPLLRRLIFLDFGLTFGKIFELQ